MATLTEERAIQILIEETLSRRAQTLDRTQEEREYRRAVREEVRELKDAGIEVRIPTTQPDLRG